MTINTWNSGQTKDITFKDFNPVQRGKFLFYGITLLATDQFTADDTLITAVTCDYDNDLAAVSVLYPSNKDTILVKSTFQPTGSFLAYGIQDSFINTPVQVQIKTCENGLLVFQADTAIPVIYPGSPALSITFPSQQGIYDIRTLVPGCYNIDIIARKQNDGDRTNDMASANFTISGTSSTESNYSIRQDILLEQNFPNPFASSTTINYALPENGRVTFRIYDITGRVIQTEAEIAKKESGQHQVNLSLQNFPSGIYIYELTFTNDKGEIIRRSERMTLMK